MTDEFDEDTIDEAVTDANTVFDDAFFAGLVASGTKIQVDGIPIITDTDEACRVFENEGVIGFDTETTGLSPWRDKIALIQMYGEQTGAAALIRIKNGIIPERVKALFRPDKLFICHNAVGFDIQFLRTHGVNWRNTNWYDTLVGETVITITGRRDVSVSLRASVKRRLGLELNKKIEHRGWGREDLNMEQIQYAMRDVISLPALMRSQIDKAKDLDVLTALREEMQVMPVFASMTGNGMPLPVDNLRIYLATERQRASEKQMLLHRALGEINLSSVVQLQAALRRVGINLQSTGVDFLNAWLEENIDDQGIITNLLSFRHHNQRLKMYNDKWIEKNIENDWVHPRFWQCAADTTRVTCSDPNMQQVPKDGRHIIGNVDGWSIVACDYSQIEVRVSAYITQDQALLEAINSEDIHYAVASLLFGKPIDEISKEMRKLAKAATFVFLFGGGIPRFYSYAKSAGSSITYDQAVEAFGQFMQVFYGVAARRKYALNRTSSRRPVGIRLVNGHYRLLTGGKVSPTTFLNTEVQGNASVGMKRGMLEVDRRGMTSYLGLAVHDELVARVPTAEAKEYGAELSDAMIVGMRSAIPVPVTTELKIDRFWLP